LLQVLCTVIDILNFPKQTFSPEHIWYLKGNWFLNSAVNVCHLSRIPLLLLLNKSWKCLSGIWYFIIVVYRIFCKRLVEHFFHHPFDCSSVALILNFNSNLKMNPFLCANFFDKINEFTIISRCIFSLGQNKCNQRLFALLLLYFS